MLPDGILKASTRNVRRKNQTTSATTIDLAHSQTQMMAERERSAGPPRVPEGRDEPAEVEELVEGLRAVMPWSRKEESSSITGWAAQTASRSAARTLAG